MSTNDAVGKKIVEALKKQSNQEIELTQEVEEIEDVNSVDDELEYIQSIQEDSDGPVEFIEEPVSDQFEIREQEERAEQKFESTQQQVFQSTEPTPAQSLWNFSEAPMQQQVQSFTSMPSGAKQFEMPSNVAVLKKLITQLPSGVTRQTGAQIIKQTMEALGISMNTVLHEAQKVQDDMNDSIKNCMVTIQEYKNNIKSLEKQGLDYQRQVNQLNDLISLFILSDKD